MTMHKALNLRDGIDRRYVSRKEGGRGLASVDDVVDVSARRLEDYIKKRKKTRNSTSNMNINRTTITEKQKLEEKQLDEYFKQLTDEISHEKTRTGPRKRNIKRENESLQIAA